MFMHGNFTLLPEQRLAVFVDDLNLNHKKILEYVPEQFLEELGSLKITGSSNLTSEISVSLPENQEPIIETNGEIFVKAGIEYPEQLLTLGLL